jgi:hypothetical protein
MVSGGFSGKYPRNRLAQNLDATKVYGHIWRKVQRRMDNGVSEFYIRNCLRTFFLKWCTFPTFPSVRLMAY